MSKCDPISFFFAISIIVTAVIVGLLWWMRLSVLYSYLIGVSVITFIYYGYDKRQAINNGTRVPEIILHVLTLFGGTPGAFLGQIFFRHKTKKLRFRIAFLLIVLLQVIVGCYCWFF
jgi:uncharacterized membrane protein YsdA (DUF1294 family)